MDWYYKAALAVALVWATARVLGAYGEQSRELDISFLYGFLLTLGGWAAVFLIIDRVLKFFGWKRAAIVTAPDAGTPDAAAAEVSEPADSDPAPAAGTPSAPPDRGRTARRARR